MQRRRRSQSTQNQTRRKRAQHRIQIKERSAHNQGSQQEHRKTQNRLTGRIRLRRHNLAQTRHMRKQAVRNQRRNHRNHHKRQQHHKRHTRRTRRQQQRNSENRQQLTHSAVHQHRITHRRTGGTMRLQHRQQRTQRRRTQRHTYRNIRIQLTRERRNNRRTRHTQGKAHHPGGNSAITLTATQRGHVNLKARNQKEHAQAKLLQQRDTTLTAGKVEHIWANEQTKNEQEDHIRDLLTRQARKNRGQQRDQRNPEDGHKLAAIVARPCRKGRTRGKKSTGSSPIRQKKRGESRKHKTSTWCMCRWGAFETVNGAKTCARWITPPLRTYQWYTPTPTQQHLNSTHQGRKAPVSSRQRSGMRAKPPRHRPAGHSFHRYT